MDLCVKSELDLFQKKAIQTSILDSQVIGYKPLSTADSSTLEFVIPRSSEHYRDLSSTHLKLLVKLSGNYKTKTENNVTTVVEKAACINALLHSLFSQIQVFINNTNVTQSGDNYPYKAYIEILLNYSKDSIETYLKNQLFYLDSGDFLANDRNTGFVEREKQLKNTVELVGRLHSDIFQTDLLLPINNELKVRLTRSSNSFVLLSSEEKSGLKLEILDATLLMKSVLPAASIVVSHLRLLNNNINYKFHYDRSEVTVNTVAQGQRIVSIDNLILGKLPKFICFAFVNNSDVSGKNNSNPFKFTHYKLSSFSLRRNGVQIPSEAIQPVWNENRFATAYSTLFTQTHLRHGPMTIAITPEMYSSSYFLICQDLTPDSSIGSSHTSITPTGSIRLDLTFAEPLPNPTSIITYAVYDSLIEIAHDNSVLVR